MANRSDFHDAKLPRYLKRMLSLHYEDAHHNGEMKRMFIQAHAAHKAAIDKRSRAESFDAVEDGEE